jgi:hypothetical protein
MESVYSLNKESIKARELLSLAISASMNIINSNLIQNNVNNNKINHVSSMLSLAEGPFGGRMFLVLSKTTWIWLLVLLAVDRLFNLEDKLHSNGLLCDQFPHLFSYALEKDASVVDFLNSQDLCSLFSIHLSVHAFQVAEPSSDLFKWTWLWSFDQWLLGLPLGKFKLYFGKILQFCLWASTPRSYFAEYMEI